MRRAWPPTSPLVTGTRVERATLPSRGGRGVRGLDLPQGPTGSLRARTILIRQALVRAAFCLRIDPLSCVTLELTVEGPLTGRREGGGREVVVESRLSTLYRAPIKGSLSERLRGPKKGMFIL